MITMRDHLYNNTEDHENSGNYPYFNADIVEYLIIGV